MFGYAVFVVVMLVMKLAPQSPLGQWLNLHLVELPLLRTRKLEYRRLIWLVLLLVVALAASDMVALMGADVLTAYAWDLTVYLDAMVLAYAAAAVARGRAALRWLALRGSLPIRRRIASRARRSRAAAAKPKDGADNDDDPALAWSRAA